MPLTPITFTTLEALLARIEAHMTENHAQENTGDRTQQLLKEIAMSIPAVWDAVPPEVGPQFPPWDAGVTYEANEQVVVEHNGFLYLFVGVDNSLNEEPGTDVSVWQDLSALILSHVQGTDLALAAGTANEVTAAEIRAHLDGGDIPTLAEVLAVGERSGTNDIGIDADQAVVFRSSESEGKVRLEVGEVTDDQIVKMPTGSGTIALVGDVTNATRMGTCLFVNALTGTSGGVRGSLSQQYSTVDEALADLVAGDTIVILDSGTYSVSSLIILDTTIYAPNATITGVLKLAVNEVKLRITCKSLTNGIQSVDGDGVPTTGTVATLNVETCLADVTAENLYVNGGFFSEKMTCEHGELNGVAIAYNNFQIRSGRVNNSSLGYVMVVSGSSVEFHNTKIDVIESDSGVCTVFFYGGSIATPFVESDFIYSAAGTLGIPAVLTHKFAVGVVDEDPGSGNWGADSSFLPSATYLRISDTDFTGADITTYMSAQGAGQLVMRTSDGASTVIFQVSSIVAVTGYYKVFVNHLIGDFTAFYPNSFYTFNFRKEGV